MSNKQQAEVLQESLEHGHEVRDANPWNVALYGGGMLTLIIMVGLVFSVIVYDIMVRASRGAPPPPQFQMPQNELPPAPRLEEHPWLDLKDLRDAETRQLESYGWVDKEHGVVRIPIERAMDLIAQRGLPANPGGSNPSGPKTSVPSQSPGKK